MKLNFRPRSYASRTLWIAVASAIFGLVVAGLVGFWTLSNQLDDRATMEMRGRADLVVHILSTIPSLTAVVDSGGHFAELFYGHDDLHLALADPSTGKILLASSDVASHSITEINHAKHAPDKLHTWVLANGAKFSEMDGVAKVGDGSAVRFYLSVDRHRAVGLLAGFFKATLLTLPLLLVIVAVGAGLIARAGLTPFRSFNLLAASIGTQSLNKRVSLSGLPGEFQEMATEFNGMLDRIDEGYRRLQGFSGDLAHEMRTPVATLLGRTEVALSQRRTAAELREVLEGNAEELDRLTALISDMLFIARADHNATPIQPESVDLVLEAERVAEYMAMIADEKQVRIDVTGTSAEVLADRLMVERAITNLVSNAIRHANPHSTVSIGITAAGDRASLVVANEGERIAPDHVERIFERFYRVDQGRSRGEGGSGLGLAIVRSIAKLHDGSIAVRSEGGRTSFTLSLPRELTAGKQAAGYAPASTA